MIDLNKIADMDPRVAAMLLDFELENAKARSGDVSEEIEQSVRGLIAALWAKHRFKENVRAALLAAKNEAKKAERRRKRQARRHLR